MKSGVFSKILRGFLMASIFCLFVAKAAAQDQLQDRIIVEPIEIAFEEKKQNPETLKIQAEQFRQIIQEVLGSRYSLVKIRQSLQELYDTGKIVSASVEAKPIGDNKVSLRYLIKRKTQIRQLIVNVGKSVGEKITEEEILLRANFLSVGALINEQSLKNNADSILGYLRERGFYNAKVSYKLENSEDDETQATVIFNIEPENQARVERFDIDIKGFNASSIKEKLELKAGEYFSDRRLDRDFERIRQELVKRNYLAPFLNNPQVVFDPDENKVSIFVKGNVGPEVEVKIEAGDGEVGQRSQQRLLPIKREGRLEQSAIVEGARRLRNYFQEKGYFFAEVKPVCAVSPPAKSDERTELKNYTEFLCGFLSSLDLENRKVEVIYKVELNRRLNLKKVRIEGTNKITIEDVLPVLQTQRASLLGLIPNLGYGRGYTSNEILENDRQQIQAIMQQLGYRQARVRVGKGVSPTGEDLIVTFLVEEGPLTRVSEVEIVGNSGFSTDELKKQLPQIEGREYSPARIRNGLQKLSNFYAENGYFDARLSYRIVELPSENGQEQKVKVIYNIENEGKRAVTNRILINGNENTKRPAILRATSLQSGELLKASDIARSEQNLYATDVFRRVEIKTAEAGTISEKIEKKDITINVEEQKPRNLQYGSGYSTDTGPFVVASLSHNNLFGSLQQGNILARISRLQQLLQISFLNPYFLREGKGKFSPLRITAQYQRDATVTRFFRSAFDKGTFGIVQRLDPNGNPIDVFGNRTGNPTINRLTLTTEIQKNLNLKRRGVLFVKYRFEDIRLFKIGSLLIKDLLEPDAKVRISGFGVTTSFDTRKNCTRRQTLLELIQKGEVENSCRYNPIDATSGYYFFANYDVSLPSLGSNIGFQRFQATFQRYFTPKNDVTFAGRMILGAGQVFSEASNRFPPNLSALRGSLPISERFFAGGSTTLRGFDFESAGPRIVTVPSGLFRTGDGRFVFLPPFTTPFGGNALAIANLEIRYSPASAFQIVPFYDGGNVFQKVEDIFNPPRPAPNDVLRSNLKAIWTNTFGLGLRIKTPIGGSIAIDFGYLTNPPEFLIPQTNNTNAIYRLRQTQVHFRFTQSF
jgi:outer membrane protein insertion porin family